MSELREPATIRLATQADASELARLRYVFRAEERMPTEPESTFRERCHEWMHERLDGRASWQCWVAVEQGLIVGTIRVQLFEKIPNPAEEFERHAYISNFFVLDSRRGQGLGGRLLTAALDWCRRQQVNAVILWPSKRSRPIYLRHGFAVSDQLLQQLLR